MKQDLTAQAKMQEALIPLKDVPWTELLITIGGLIGGRRKKRKQIAVVNEAMQEVFFEQSKLQIVLDSLSEWQRYQLLIQEGSRQQSWSTKQAQEMESFVSERIRLAGLQIDLLVAALTRGVALVESLIYDYKLQQEASQHGILLRLGAVSAALRNLPVKKT